MIFFVADLFVEQYEGGAELTTEALCQSSLFPIHKVLSASLNPKKMEQLKDSFWIFGNFTNLSEDCILYAIKNLKYSVLEYDYKYCKYRSSGKHIEIEGECSCQDTRSGKIVSMFLNSSIMTWWMSRQQKEHYQKLYPFLKDSNNRVLSSVFSHETLDYIESLDTTKKNNKWIIINSQSWIKGVQDAVEYAEKNDLEYELLWGLEHRDFLKKLAESPGLIFLPKAGDTCPRMVIEAKLLDCELILNHNVQHRNEGWFVDKEKTMEHLRSRTSIFWNTLEVVAAKYLEVPEADSDTNTRYQIVVPFCNAEKWVGKCIESLKRQRHRNFVCTMVDDVSTDNTFEAAKKSIGDDTRFRLIKNKEKRYALGNIAHVLERTECHDNDVVVLLDGDDWLASHRTLCRLSEAYMDEECLLTYGSYVYYPAGTRGVEPSEYSEETINNNTFRQDQWRASHLRTFKYSLWKHLNHDDLKDEEGDYYKMTYDQAIMLPLLEMAAERSRYIPEILHVYNNGNPLNVDKIKAQEQFELAQRIREKQKYERI